MLITSSRVFKRWADKAAPPNLMAYLFNKDNVRQSFRLGLAGAWKSDHPELRQWLCELAQSCPLLISGLIHSGEDPEFMSHLQLSRHNPDPVYYPHPVHLKPSVYRRLGGVDLAVKFFQNDLGGPGKGFSDALQLAYCDDFSLHISQPLHYAIACFESVRFHDRYVINILLYLY
jgi:hypothetical protein